MQEEKVMWVCITAEDGSFSVGFYDPAGNFSNTITSVPDQVAALRWVHYLNGGNSPMSLEGLSI